MFSQELTGYISHGKEETYLEYKSSMRWANKTKNKEDKITKYTIVKAMLAMSNHRDGGVVVIGEKEIGNGEFRPVGISKMNYDSFKYDDISRYLKGICQPQIEFKITRDKLSLNGKDTFFVIIQIAEAKETPVICTKTILYDDSNPALGNNVLLRENCIYIRPKSPIESREISSVQEWRDLISRILDNNREELLRRMPCSEFFEKNRKIDKKIEAPIMPKADTMQFNKQLESDKL